ncbi:Biopterin transport-related protein BT1 [Heracleum sosnowskyi]|uniref:Biopterin transport-related protein BT1 n=1 Tax=Heracleum sosnowskyi TaxID=360622 RepID=A0AAD8MC36_9APIA|nr:Biopterin transport-related protein BT1 [Heracleum sosnowskyi]
MVEEELPVSSEVEHYESGLGGALGRVGTEYYMKDVQKVQPSEAQVYSGITNIPWLVKPLWGLLTDVVPIFGYRRRPYFIFAGIFGLISMLFLSLHKNLHILFALLSLLVGSAGVAIADVTIDACVAQKSGSHPSLAADMQSLCSLSASIGALIGFSISGIFVHLIGPRGVYGLLTIPAGLLLLVGFVLKEPHTPNFAYGQGLCLPSVHLKFQDATTSMWNTLMYPEVWRPCLYMYLSFALSLNIYEGMFYWYTDSQDGPSFSKYGLKNHPFRNLLFWTQLVLGLSGMLDLVLVLRINLKLGIPDYVFAVIDESIYQMTAKLKWMPLLVLSSKLCPSGIEGTFFALLMSIDNAGVFSSTWGGGLLLHLTNVTRTQFGNLWLAILIRNVLRLVPISLLFLVSRGDPASSILPNEEQDAKAVEDVSDTKDIELVSLVNNGDGR